MLLNLKENTDLEWKVYIQINHIDTNSELFF